MFKGKRTAESVGEKLLRLKEQGITPQVSASVVDRESGGPAKPTVQYVAMIMQTDYSSVHRKSYVSLERTGASFDEALAAVVAAWNNDTRQQLSL